MAAAFKEGHIQSAFKSNGQINKEGIIPDVHALAGTYRASITNDHYLKDTTTIIKSYYKEMYLTGRIDEKTFDRDNVVRDYDNVGNYITRDFGISKDNCQHAKILSAPNQRQERIALIATIQKNMNDKQKAMFNTESTKYKLQDECIERVIKGYNALSNIEPINNIPTLQTNPESSCILRTTFMHLIPNLKHTHFGLNKHKGYSIYRPTMPQMKAFIQLREEVTTFKKNKPVYKKLKDQTSEQLIDLCMVYRTKPLQPRIYQDVQAHAE